MFKALGLSWAFVGIILAFLSSSQAKPNPYYSLYGGHQAPIRPSYGWTQQAAAGIPSNAAIEVPYSYFVEGIFAFTYFSFDELSCKLSSSISIDRTQIRYEWLQACSAILPKAIIRQQCRLRKEKTSIGSIEEGWWWSTTSRSIATKTESCTIVNPILHLSMICSFERHKYCTDDFWIIVLVFKGRAF